MLVRCKDTTHFAGKWIPGMASSEHQRRRFTHRLFVSLHILLDLLHLVVRFRTEPLDRVTGTARVLRRHHLVVINKPGTQRQFGMVLCCLWCCTK